MVTVCITCERDEMKKEKEILKAKGKRMTREQRMYIALQIAIQVLMCAVEEKEGMKQCVNILLIILVKLHEHCPPMGAVAQGGRGVVGWQFC